MNKAERAAEFLRGKGKSVSRLLFDVWLITWKSGHGIQVGDQQLVSLARQEGFREDCDAQGERTEMLNCIRCGGEFAVPILETYTGPTTSISFTCADCVIVIGREIVEGTQEDSDGQN